MSAVATASSLEERIRNRTAVVGVIGLGYVGLPLVAGFARNGFPVVGFDIDPSKVSSLEANRSYLSHFPNETLEQLHRDRRFTATCDFSRLRECDVIIICVPTPLTLHREPDLSYIESTAKQIAGFARSGQLIVLESTTYPGTTEEILKPALEAAGFVLDRDFYLAFSPEREDPNNPHFVLKSIPKIVGGATEASGRLACLLYGSVVDRVVPVGSARLAEATKLVENIFRCVNIALVNELKICFDKMGIDVWEVLDAAATKPFGFMKFEPGPGLGGHCIAGSETARVRSASLDTALPLDDLFERYRALSPAVQILGAEVLLPRGLDALSLDLATGSTRWRPVAYLFKRRFVGQMVQIRLDGNRTIRTTDRHPMLVLHGDSVEIREARDLKPGDRVPQFCGMTGSQNSGRALRWAGGNALRVDGISRMPGSEDVYSLEVPGSHTFAATGGVFVHNCIPIDPFYLTWKAREFGIMTRFIELAGEVNTAMPEWVLRKLSDALNERGRSLKGSRILILGIAYKKNVDDIRESPALEIMELLRRQGAEIAYHDPYVPQIPRTRKHHFDLSSVDPGRETVSAFDAVVIVTDHDSVDYGSLAKSARLIVDTRNALRRRGIMVPSVKA